MHWYEIAKIVHFLGLIGLFGFFVIQAQVGMRLRAAASTNEARTWTGMLAATRGMLLGGTALLTLSGFAMAGLRWRGAFPFVAVGLVTLLVIVIVWMVTGARHLRTVRDAIGESDGPVSPELARVILDAPRWGTTGALNGAALGVLFVMTWKPDWAGSVIIVLLMAVIVGGITTASVARRRRKIVS